VLDGDGVEDEVELPARAFHGLKVAAGQEVARAARERKGALPLAAAHGGDPVTAQGLSQLPSQYARERERERGQEVKRQM